MITKLQNCREIELKEKGPCFPEDLSYSLAALYKRGLIELKKEIVNGKEIMVVHIAPAGIAYLEAPLLL